MPDLYAPPTKEEVAAAKSAAAKDASLYAPPTDEELKRFAVPKASTFGQAVLDPKSGVQAAIRGGAHGVPFVDEAAAVPGALFDYVQSKLGNRGDISLANAYTTRRDAIRRADAEAQTAHPITFGASQLAGTIAGAVTGGAALKGAQGALGVGQVATEAAAAEPLAQTLAQRAVGFGKGVLVAGAKGAATGAGYGALSGADQAKNWTDIPAEAVRGAETGALFGGALGAGGKIVVEGAKAAGPLIGSVLGGVSKENIAKYAAAPERITEAGNMSEDAVKDAVDSAVSTVMGDKTSLADKAAKMEETINSGYAAKQAELAGSVTPLAKAKEMVGTLENQKAYLTSLSEQADDALTRSGATFQKGDLLKAVDRIGTSKGTAIGDEAHNALARLQVTRDRIASQLPDEIPATQMRDVLQQLRKDVNFDQGAGEFNDTLNGMRKEFSAQVSGALKKASPEYAHYMQRMSALSENLATMNRYFGDESKAIGSLEALRKGGARAQLIEDALQNHATVNGDQSMLEHLAEIRQNQALLGRIKNGEDLRATLFPDSWNALQEAQANAQMGAEVAAPIERLGQNRTQSVIRNQGGTVPNIEDRRALEALSQTGGQNFPQMISDKNVANAFKKGQTNGSRMAVIGGSLGSGLGYLAHGAPGAAIGLSAGTTLGGVADKYGPAITKSVMDLSRMLSTSSGVQKLGEFAGPLLEASKNGAAAMAVTNAYLYSTNPDYRKIMQNEQQKSAIGRRLGE